MNAIPRHSRGVVLVAAFLVSAFQTAWGAEPTAEITGRVTDLNDPPLAFANVIVLGTSKGAMTDSEGNFRIKVSPETYTLKVSYLGYSSEKRELRLEEGESKVQAFSLHKHEHRKEGLVHVVVFACGTRSNRSVAKKKTVTSRTQKVSRMLPPYPNPVSGPLTLRFSIAERSHTQIRVFDIQGRLVSKIVDEPLDPGSYSRTWTGATDAGRTAASGVYFVSFLSTGDSQTMKVIVIR